MLNIFGGNRGAHLDRVRKFRKAVMLDLDVIDAEGQALHRHVSSVICRQGLAVLIGLAHQLDRTPDS
jgi:hypothetical protein